MKWSIPTSLLERQTRISLNKGKFLNNLLNTVSNIFL
ncbi:unnamed protein product [Schistosoma mattheei]|uniref:Uncharacterized protein n=1 Tax=Schistosoma mattheei TaxID=31246 RepID=A0A183PYQ5_9TREM|nr:unnamed protein product [Schistosoma mattheei]